MEGAYAGYAAFIGVVRNAVFGLAVTVAILLQQKAAFPEWLPVLGEDRFELRPDLFPVGLHVGHEGEMMIGDERLVGHQRQAAVDFRQQLEGAEAEHLDLRPPPSLEGRLALRPANCLCSCHVPLFRPAIVGEFLSAAPGACKVDRGHRVQCV